MKVVLCVECEKADFILFESQKKFMVIQMPRKEEYAECMAVFGTYEEAKKYLFELL